MGGTEQERQICKQLKGEVLASGSLLGAVVCANNDWGEAVFQRQQGAGPAEGAPQRGCGCNNALFLKMSLGPVGEGRPLNAVGQAARARRLASRDEERQRGSGSITGALEEAELAESERREGNGGWRGSESSGYKRYKEARGRPGDALGGKSCRRPALDRIEREGARERE